MVPILGNDWQACIYQHLIVLPPTPFFFSPLSVNNKGDMAGFIIQVINYTQVAINESQRDYKEFPPLILGYMVWRKWQGKVRMLSHSGMHKTIKFLICFMVGWQKMFILFLEGGYGPGLGHKLYSGHTWVHHYKISTVKCKDSIQFTKGLKLNYEFRVVGS